MVVQIFRVKINGDQGALFLPIDRVAKACPGILWADKNDMAEIEEMMEKTQLERKRYIRNLYLTLSRGKIDLGPIEEPAITTLAYQPQKGEPKNLVIASMGRAPDDHFFLKDMAGNKVAGAETIAYHTDGGGVLAIGLFQDKVVRWETYADLSAYQSYRDENAYPAD
jgi:hypothetical protein